MSTSFQISKHKLGHYAELPGASDAWICMLLQSTGLVADGTLADYDDVAALLAGTTDEASFTNYVRKTITAITITLDDTNNRVLIDVPDQVWTAAGGALNQSLGMALLAYDPDTTTGTDATLIPLLGHTIAATTDGNDLTVRYHADGVARVL